MKREKINLTDDELQSLWDGVYYVGRDYELKGKTYTQVAKINTSDESDGPSWDYVIQRKQDSKFFKFNVWDAGTHNGYVFEDKFIIEVFQKQTVIYE